MRETVYRCDSCDARLTSDSDGITVTYADEVTRLMTADWSNNDIHLCNECRPEWLGE